MSKNVAFISFGIGNISGGGGAERFFADLYDYYTCSSHAKFELYWLLDKQSITNLNEVNKLKSVNGVIPFKIFSNRFKIFLENIQVLKFILLKRISLIHIPLYNVHYLPLLNYIQKLPDLIRPKITINIVDCSLPFCYLDPSLPRHTDVIGTWAPLFKNVKVNGYISWNESFVDFANKQKVVLSKPVLYSIRSRFCDTGKFAPENVKSNRIVFASRLAVFKNTDWFINAVSYLKANYPDKLKGWQFTICGDGPRKNDLLKQTRELGLEDKIEFLIEPNLEKVLNTSRCFVSCQDFDNFPSLSMAEAMASGNVIVSRNVGQTGLFVEEGKNGFLCEEDSSLGIAKALLKVIENTDKLEVMAKHSVYLMKEIHTPENFIPQLDEFWEKVLND